MWIVALVVAAVLLTFSTRQLILANPRSPLPWMRRPEQEPGSTLVLRVAGAFAGLLAAVLTPTSLLGWFFLGIVLAFLPTAILQARHNSRVGR
ncbi:MAG: hypothetical protein L0H79_05405 [Intrasporangium sp.]|uniref:hypothetical protein n=1 Tax=Intrasporangium sp. TaxID=1925024 RepID=UPI00264A0545|nr:hypothetical protein [Intrasporangium sp.]MDN5795173.1 hypothetical protein [Intrasporangium sp.]